MFKNFMKIALRSLLRRKAYTLINVFGLATGMAGVPADYFIHRG
ncbi:MAG: hypothetical protein WDO19_28090 [Bacteroidota bacterium]